MPSVEVSSRKFARDAWLRALALTASIERSPTLTLPILVDTWAEQRLAAPALVSPEALPRAAARRIIEGLARQLRSTISYDQVRHAYVIQFSFLPAEA